jgi:hypothetical protein
LREPDGRRPGRALIKQTHGIYISPNGRLPATLPEPIKRARDKDIRGLAGEGNVVEAERAICKRSETERPIGLLGLSAGRLLGDGYFWASLTIVRAKDGEDDYLFFYTTTT